MCRLRGESSRRGEVSDIQWVGIVYEKHRKAVLHQTLVLTGDADLAAELAAEVFFRVALMSPQNTEKIRSVDSWLYGVTRNVVRQEFRRRRAGLEISKRIAGLRNSEATRPDVENEVLCEIRILKVCLTRLSSLRRQIFSAHYELGRTTREISLDMGIAESTVKSHLQRGRRQLRSWLLSAGIAPPAARGRMPVTGLLRRFSSPYWRTS